MWRLRLKVHFDSAHSLRNYQGKESHIHGHRWTVEVVLKNKGDLGSLDQLGMLVDPRLVKQSLSAIISRLSDCYLNDIQPYDTLNPTAENLAYQIFTDLRHALEGEQVTYKLESAAVSEIPDVWAEYREM